MKLLKVSYIVPDDFEFYGYGLAHNTMYHMYYACHTLCKIGNFFCIDCGGELTAGELAASQASKHRGVCCDLCYLSIVKE